ncbi:hypothetical protein ABE55_14375 [Bacillus thuringiensis]|uniref:toll/interleukin-1 receptor domain-containing protein n=1 Tax=Bacillus cereus group TaxID=86661 RepID=UPI0013750EFB|nr:MULTISPECIES: toll/interleukin-1 receptor domain-containing protein [Bacillus cereus group]MBG9467716.1 hypothetical protein [Bacillus thuringiensis]
MNTNDFFISHATADHELVSEIVDFMEVALKVDRKKIYCTSGEGTKKIRTGTNFISDIKDNVRGTKLVIFILTPNYFKSNFCLAELGAAWAFSSNVYPIVIPPTPRELLKSTPLSEATQALTLKTYDDLVEMADEFKDMGAAEYGSAKVLNNRAKRLIQWIKDNCSFDIEESVSKAEHSNVQEQLEDLKRENHAKQMEIVQLTTQYEHTLKAVREENAKIKNDILVLRMEKVGRIEPIRIMEPIKEKEKETINLLDLFEEPVKAEEEETADKWVLFEEHVKNVKNTTSQLHDLVLSAIYYDEFHHGTRFWPVGDFLFSWEEVKQLELENLIHVDRDDMRITPNYDRYLVRQAIDILHELLHYTLTGIDEKMEREFVEEQKIYLDFNSKNFWGKILSVYIYDV